jgi:hypothetical protein
VISEIMAAADKGIPEEFWSMQNASPWCRIRSRVDLYSAQRTTAPWPHADRLGL